MPATYRIRAQGELEDSRSNILAGMSITTSFQEDEGVVATLVGRLKDQAELSGVLNTLYEMHLPLLSVEILSDEEPI
jgi:hypothetical protein